MSLPTADETWRYSGASPVSGAWASGLWTAGAVALVLAALGPAAVAVSLGVVVAAAVVTVVVSSRGRATRPGLLVAAGLAGLVALPVAGLQSAVQPAAIGLPGALPDAVGDQDDVPVPGDSALLPPVTEEQPVLVQEFSEPGLEIPDDDEAGIRDTIVVAQAGRVEDIRVGVDIAHPYVGDLTVELVAPSGQAVILHRGDGGSQDDLSVVYERATTPGLVAVVGDAADGVWALHVKDTAGGDSGTLQSWELEVTAS